jgi:hypothetical protein
MGQTRRTRPGQSSRPLGSNYPVPTLAAKILTQTSPGPGRGWSSSTTSGAGLAKVVDDYTLMGSTYAGRTIGIEPFYSPPQGRSTQFSSLKHRHPKIGSKALDWRDLGIVRPDPYMRALIMLYRPSSMTVLEPASRH